MTYTLPQKLYRNTEPKYANAFVEEGEILFRPLTFYRNIEDPTRRDENDGVWVKDGPVKKLTLTFNDLPVGRALKGIPIRPEVIRNVLITVPTPNSGSRLISCFATDRQESFGTGAIEIFDVSGFVECVFAKVKEDHLELNWGLVEYYDFNSHLPDQNNLWLQKDKCKFSTQKEFRLGIVFSDPQIEQLNKHGKNFTVGTTCLVRCGSLKKFAQSNECSIKYYISNWFS